MCIDIHMHSLFIHLSGLSKLDLKLESDRLEFNSVLGAVMTLNKFINLSVHFCS